MIKIYQNEFINEIEITSKEDAIHVINHFCEFCQKDSISQWHCSYADTEKCYEIKKQIKKDYDLIAKY